MVKKKQQQKNKQEFKGYKIKAKAKQKWPKSRILGEEKE